MSLVLQGHFKELGSEIGTHAGVLNTTGHARSIPEDFDCDMSPASGHGLHPLSSVESSSTNDYNSPSTHVYQSLREDSIHRRLQTTPITHGVVPKKRKGRRHHTRRHKEGRTGNKFEATSMITSSDLGNEYPCTECLATFKNAGSWKRHENSVHGYSEEVWTCVLTDPFTQDSGCVFCSVSMGTIKQSHGHEIEACLSKCITDRTFTRKDYLKQHVLQTHLAGAPDAVRKSFKVPHDWSRDMEPSLRDPKSLWCGFCKVMLATTNMRMGHVSKHFQEGRNMATWEPLMR